MCFWCWGGISSSVPLSERQLPVPGCQSQEINWLFSHVLRAKIFTIGCKMEHKAKQVLTQP